MSLKLRYVWLDVFTTTRFKGNPLAIVHLPHGTELSQVDKQRIAAEFNLSETVFLHESATSSEGEPIEIDIFTTTEELPFAGHPTVGTGWYLLSNDKAQKGSITLKTKAGGIPITQQGVEGHVLAQVPIDIKIHAPYTEPSLKSLQPHLQDADFVNGASGGEALVSIVKGMTFILLELTSEDALSRMQRYPTTQVISSDLNLGAWGGFVGVYGFYEDVGRGIVRTRMFFNGMEDPATGSAASTLGVWLAKKKGVRGLWKVEIVQGVEMGRRSDIVVEVEVGASGEVEKVSLGGSAVRVMEGWLI